MTPMSLEEIAAAIHIHIIQGTLDIAYLNSCLFPATSIRFALNTTPYNPEVLVGDGRPEAFPQIHERSSQPATSLNGKDPPAENEVNADVVPATDRSAQPTNDYMNDSHARAIKRTTISPPERGPSPSNTISKRTHTDADIQSQSETEHWGGDTRAKAQRLDLNTAPSRAALRSRSEAEFLNNAKKTFISKWAKKTKAFGDWDSLGSFAYVGKKLGQEPFQELDVLMSCIVDWGSHRVQSDFKRSVHTWIKSKDKTRLIETPNHLRTIEGFDPLPFQRLWKAYRRAQITKGAENMAIIIRRRALVELSAAYQEVIDYIRNSLCDGLRLEKGETAVARARKILYTTLYPDMPSQKKMTSRFNYEIRRAAPYYQLRQHYNNDGILAMIPSRFSEGTIQLAPRIPVMVQILDILRPDLREGPRLSFFSKLISMIFEDVMPDPATLTELDKWTSVDNVSIRWLPDIDPVLAVVGDSEFPVNGLYRSETERAMLFDLPKDDREEIMSQRFDNLQRQDQPE